MLQATGEIRTLTTYDFCILFNASGQGCQWLIYWLLCCHCNGGFLYLNWTISIPAYKWCGIATNNKYYAPSNINWLSLACYADSGGSCKLKLIWYRVIGLDGTWQLSLVATIHHYWHLTQQQFVRVLLGIVNWTLSSLLSHD